MSPNLAQLIMAEDRHEKFLRMSFFKPKNLFFFFFQQCTAKHCRSDTLALPDTLGLTCAFIRADASIASVLIRLVLACTVASFVFTGTPSETANSQQIAS